MQNLWWPKRVIRQRLPLKAAAKGAKAKSRQPPLILKRLPRAVTFGGRQYFRRPPKALQLVAAQALLDCST